MLKKILIGLGILVLVFVAFSLSYFYYFTRLASPEANVHYESEYVQIDLNYCQPSKKGRIIFGLEEEGALIPYGKYWRLGANQATEIEFNQNVTLKDTEIEAGRYWLYAIPNQNYWLIRLNSALGEWGATMPDNNLDVAEVKIQTNEVSEKELFTITIDEYENGALMTMQWDKTSVEIPIRPIN